jgi:hypothetical protein
LELGVSEYGWWATAPFAPFGQLVVGHGGTSWLAAMLGLGAAELVAAAILLYRMETWLVRMVQRREAARYARARLDRSATATADDRDPIDERSAHRSSGHPGSRNGTQGTTAPQASGHCTGEQGWGPSWSLLWRQWIGLRQRWASVFIGLAIATLLIIVPVLSGRDERIGFTYVVGSLVFYSLILLPANLKLDFRRDIDRMYLFKLLPLNPWKVVAMQIGVPVIVLTGYQTFVLTLTCLLQPVAASLWIGCLLVLVPLNVVIVALENLIYLWYPYRLNQEGIEVFIRTTLAFTGKSLLYGVGLGLVILWIWSTSALDRLNLFPLSRLHLFLVGVFAAQMVLAAATFGLLVRAYDRFDPTTDVPGH